MLHGQTAVTAFTANSSQNQAVPRLPFKRFPLSNHSLGAPLPTASFLLDTRSAQALLPTARTSKLFFLLAVGHISRQVNHAKDARGTRPNAILVVFRWSLRSKLQNHAWDAAFLSNS